MANARILDGHQKKEREQRMCCNGYCRLPGTTGMNISVVRVDYEQCMYICLPCA